MLTGDQPSRTNLGARRVTAHRLSAHIERLLTAALLVVTCLATASPAAAEVAPAWTPIGIPGPPGPLSEAVTTTEDLTGIDCESSGFCAVVAGGAAVRAPRVGYVEGGSLRWQTLPLPVTVEPRNIWFYSYGSIACPTPGRCVATGYYQETHDAGGRRVALVATQSREGWTSTEVPPPAGPSPHGSVGTRVDAGTIELDCVRGPWCLIVAKVSGSPLDLMMSTMHGNGNMTEPSWLPRPPDLAETRPRSGTIAVECSEPRRCVLSESYYHLRSPSDAPHRAAFFTLSDDGWSVAAPDDPAEETYGTSVTDLSCPAWRRCVAVGEASRSATGDRRGLIYRQTDRGWTAAFAEPAEPDAVNVPALVDCPAAERCAVMTVVGSGSSLFDRHRVYVQELDGHRIWRSTALPPLTPMQYFRRYVDLQCFPAESSDGPIHCVSVGEGSSSPSGAGVHAIDYWDGQTALTPLYQEATSASRAYYLDCVDVYVCLAIAHDSDGKRLLRRTTSAAPPPVVRRMLAFGDSYTSGEGNTVRELHYDCGTDLHDGSYYEHSTVQVIAGRGGRVVWSPTEDCDTRTFSNQMPADLFERPVRHYENMCHRGSWAYPNQIRDALGVTLDRYQFLACSGATTEHVLLRGRYTKSPANVAGGRSQIETVDRTKFSPERPPHLVTIGIGGNDAGFGNLIDECMSDHCLQPGFIADALFTIRSTVRSNLVTTFRRLRQEFAGSTVVAFGYPAIVGDPVNAECTGVGIPRELTELAGSSSKELDQDELLWMRDDVIPAINAAIRDAAAEAGVVWADITDATRGYEVCSDGKPRLINGIRTGNDTGPFRLFGKESFHPNEAGHDAVARFFLDPSNGFIDGNRRLLVHNPPTGVPSAIGERASAYFGTLEVTVAGQCEATCSTPATCAGGCRIGIQGTGFAPNADMVVTLHSDPVELGTLSATNMGDIEGEFDVPSYVESGLHAVKVRGTSDDGARQYGTGFVAVTKPHLATAPAHQGEGQTNDPAVSTGSERPDTSPLDVPFVPADDGPLSLPRPPVQLRSRWHAGRLATKVRTLTLLELPSTGRVRVTCAGPLRSGCPFSRWTRRLPTKGNTLRLGRLFRRSLRPGTRIGVRVLAESGRVTDRFAITVRRRRVPRVHRTCFSPDGATRPIRCAR